MGWSVIDSWAPEVIDSPKEPDLSNSCHTLIESLPVEN